MKESWLYKHGVPIRARQALAFKMRVFLLLLFLLQGSLFANIVGAQKYKVTLQMKDKELVEVIAELRRQTGLRFFYSMDKLKAVGKVSVNVKDGEVTDVLVAVLSNTGLTYQVLNDVITIKSNEKPVQQEVIKVSGKVISKSKEPLPGVTVQLKGYTIGTSTNERGEYTLSFPKMDKPVILLFSFVGMKDIEVSYTGQKTISVTMEEMAEELESVVVTGYNNIKSSSFTGNAVTVKKEELLKASKSNVIKALQTFDPSFRIKENNVWGSDPNALPEVYIRGESGIAATKQLDRDPLSKSNLVDNPNLPTFIMDGFEISVTKLYDFDPNRIESITILKDAAATALYGSRAANGVVVITTVTPKAGKLNVSYNFVGDVTMPDLSDYNLLNAKEKLETERLAGCYMVNPENNYQSDEYRLQQEYNLKLAAVRRGVDTYWLSQPLHTVFNHKHSIYVDGGNENFRFGIDLQYTKQDGIMKGSNRDRLGAGIFIQYTYKSLSIKNNTSFQLTKSAESPYGNFADYAKQLPYNAFKDENDNYLKELRSWGTSSAVSSFNLVNPLYEPSLHNFDHSDNEEWINNLSINWNVLNGLLLKGQLSMTRTYDNNKRFLDPLSLLNSNKLSMSNMVSGELNIGKAKSFTYDMNVTLSYNGIVKNHMFNALVGVSVKENVRNSDNASYRGFPSGILSSPEYAQEQVGKTTFAESRSRLIGFLTSLNYSFRDTYLFDASVRIDGSSAFGADRRFAPFWSMGIGINLHKYGFIKNLGVINLLKIRGSFGQTGKVNFPAYAARTSYEIQTDEWYKTGVGAVLKALGNRKLTWETTNTLDIGAELGLFQDRFYIKGSYYEKRTIDLVTDVTVPISTGFSSYRDNIGEVSNKGFELDMRIHAIRKQDINLYINANLAHNKNRILKISESLKAYNERVKQKFEDANPFSGTEMSTPFLQYEEGGSLNSIWGVRSMGISPSDGQEVYIRKDGTLTNKWSASDQVVLGNTDPKAQGSLGINFAYKQFALFASFMYECGGQRYNQTLVDKVENVNVYTSNVDKRVLTERWKNPGDIAKYKALASGRESIRLTRPTERFVQNYNMLVWNSLELSYDFSRRLIQPLQMSMLRLSVGMNDILHCSNVKQERGLNYPFARTVTISLRASF